MGEGRGMGKEAKTKLQRSEQRRSATYTESQVREIKLKLTADHYRIINVQCNLESEITYIYASVIAGIRGNSFAAIKEMLNLHAGELSRHVVNFREVVEEVDRENTRNYELVYELIEATKQAANGKCDPIIEFVKKHGNQAASDLIGGRKIGRDRGALDTSKDQAKRVKALLEKGHDRTYAIQLTAEEFNSGFSAVEKNYNRYRSDT